MALLKRTFFSVITLALAPPVYAQGRGLQNPIDSNNFGEFLEKIAQAITIIGIPLVGIFIIYSGLLFVTARGSEQQIEKAKKTFFWTVVGAALVVGAWAIAKALENLAQGF